MDKESAAKILADAGYETENISGVLMVLVSEDKRHSLGKEMEKIKKILVPAGYESSYGVKVGDVHTT